MSKNKLHVPFEYEHGDKVRVWTVFQRPHGTIQMVVKDGSTTRYVVEYVYHTGKFITDTFDSVDLTLIERMYNWDRCTCGSNSNRHADTCRKLRKM